MGRNLSSFSVKATIGLTALTLAVGCSKSSDEAVTAAPRQLYIATGLCYSGTGFTAPTINTVGKTLSRLNLDSLNYEMIHDYGDLSLEVAGTFASGLTDVNSTHLYAATENATATGSRRVDKLAKTFNGVQDILYRNSTVLASVMKGLSLTADGGVLIGGTTVIQRLDSTPTRKMATATLAWGDTFAGACATNNTAITDLVALPAYTGTTLGKYIYAHNAVGQMDIGIIGMNGSAVAADCLANAAGGATLTNSTTALSGYSAQLSATATPTAIKYVPFVSGSVTGKLFVAYSSSTINNAAAAGLSNALVVYDISETSSTGATITNGTVLYHDHQYFFGVTAIAYDETTNMLYAASSNSLATAPVGYNIEKFQIDLTASTAVRQTATDGGSFQAANSFNNCVTSMFVGQ